MIELAGFVEAGIEHVWSGRHQEHMPGLSSTVRDGDVGFMVFYCDEYIKWSSIVTAQTPLTIKAVNALREVNSGLPFGCVTLLPDDDGDCITLWSFKLRPGWLDQGAEVSVKLMVDVLANVPSMVRLSREKLLRCGGQPHVPDDLGVLMLFS